LWADEIFSVEAARHDWNGLLSFIIEDIVHPPLFYLVLKLWIAIGGESLLWLRLFPVLAASAAIVPFLLLCRELKLQLAEINLALVLMAVNGYLVYYAQELRMYSLLLFLTLCSLWLFVSFFNAKDGVKKPLVALFAVNLLLVYTQYYGWLVVGVEFIFLMFWGRQRLPSFMLSLAILILCFSPWAYAVAQVAMKKGLDGNLSSFARPNLNALVWHYATLGAPLRPRWKTELGLLLFGVPIVLWSWHAFRKIRVADKGQAITFWWLLLFSFLPAVLAFFASQALPQSVWGARQLIIVAAPYMILVAVAVYQLRPNWLRAVAILLVVGSATLSGFKSPMDTQRAAYEVSVRQMIEAEPTQANGIMVYTLSGHVATAIKFYLESAGERRFEVLEAEDLTALEGDHFWVAFRESREKKERPLQEILTDSGYQVGKGFESGPPGHKVFLFPVWRR